MKFLFLLTFLAAFQLCFAARILFVIPVPSKSHYAVGERLIRNLAEKGHHVTLISPLKMVNPPKNLIEIQNPVTMNQLSRMLNGDKNSDRFSFRKMRFLSFWWMSHLGKVVTEEAMNSKAVQDFLKSNPKFDLVIGDCFLTEGMLGGFVHRFGAPLIGLTSGIANLWSNEMVGNPAPAAYVPDIFLGFTNRMTFYERCINFVYGTIAQVAHYFKHLPSQDKLMRKYFGEDLPPLQDILSKTSLVLVNHHHSLAFPRPYLPNTVEIGGFHVMPPKPLPQDIKKFMDGAKEGVILFSMGSILQSSEFPEEKLQGILKALSKLKQRVLWKYEKENLPNIPPNVKILKWLPQTDALAHPNMKLFITHGGLLSTTETVSRGVPVVGIPVFGDQPTNMKFIEEFEVGISLNYEDFNEESLLKAVNEVLSNPKYAKNMKYRSKLLQDVPIPQIDNAMYWIEYVIRHKGAPHLRAAAQDLAWYQLYLLDVYAFLALALAVFLFVIWQIFKCCKAMCCRKKKSVSSKKKKN